MGCSLCHLYLRVRVGARLRRFRRVPCKRGSNRRIMSGEEGKHEAKRQRTEGEGGPAAALGSTAAQRSAFAEDAARIRAALSGGSSSASAEPAETASSAASAAGSRHESRPNGSPHQQQLPPSDDDDDDESGGGWLRNYTAHHTRVGEAYQVSSLPVPPAASSSSVTHVSREEEVAAAAE